jgi:hypothetical protein
VQKAPQKRAQQKRKKQKKQKKGAFTLGSRKWGEPGGDTEELFILGELFFGFLVFSFVFF